MTETDGMLLGPISLLHGALLFRSIKRGIDCVLVCWGDANVETRSRPPGKAPGSRWLGQNGAALRSG